jgi:RNA polymerase sigma factor (TIGR02999 family)
MQGENKIQGQDDLSLTCCLRAVRAHEPGAEERLLSIVYTRLRQMAGARMRRERPDHTLQPTALVNEVYLRLIHGAKSPEWKDSDHFYSSCARKMRQILVDHARKSIHLKCRVELFPGVAFSEQRSEKLLALDASLEKLARMDPRGATVVDMTEFLGLTNREVAEVLRVSERTIKRDYAGSVKFLRADMANNPNVARGASA